MKTFGKRDYNLEYIKRTGCYAIIKNKVSEPIEKESLSWVYFNDLERHLFHEHHLYMAKKSLGFWD